jgi:hypothetical protein
MKVDVSLIGDGFKVSELKNYLDKVPKFKYKLELIQEFGEIRTKGPHKNKKSKFGFCWINGITLNQLKRIGPIFKTYKVDNIAINVHQKNIKNQTCLIIDSDLINTASNIGACIEIINF